MALSAPFRQALTARGLAWAVGIPCHAQGLSGRCADDLPRCRARPPAQAARPRHDIDRRADDAGDATGRTSVGGPARKDAQARFAAVRVRVADGPPSGSATWAQQHLPGEEVWLIGEHRSTGERKFYLSNLPANTTAHACRQPSRRAGSASRRISSSRKNSASTTSRDDPGQACTGTRS